MVVDLDLLPGGIERFAEWEAKVGPVSRGHVVQTGGGGQQVYARVPAKYSHLIGSSQGETNGLGPGIDIRAKGGQVVAAPSIHKSGNQYRWLTFTPGEPEDLSQAWIDLLCELSPPAAEPQARKRRRRIGTRRTASNRPRPGEPAGRNETQQRADVCGLICNICDCDPKSDVVNRVGTTLIRCQVTGHRMTHTNISRLARGLKNIPELADKTAEDVLPLFEFWFNVGRKNMTDKSWRSVKQRCIYVWDEWAVTEEGPAWDAAREIVTPALLVEANQSEHAGQFILKAICNYIQEQAQDGLWYLPCRTAMDVLKSLGIELTYMTASRWIKQFVAEGFLVKSEYRDPDCPYAIYYQTAAAAARCEDHDRQREQQQVRTLMFAPTNRVARFILPLTQPARTLADVFATAGRDEPVSTPALVFNWRPSLVELVEFRWRPRSSATLSSTCHG